MKLSLVLLPVLSLAVTLSGCQHKSSYGSGHRGEAADAEPSADADAENEKETPTHVEKKTDVDAKNASNDADEPNNGSGDEEAPKDELCYKADEQICQIELRILELVNKERAAPTKSSGGFFGGGDSSAKPALANGKKLAFIARQWSAVQGQRNSIGHDGFPNQRRELFQQEFNASAQMGGENVAMFGGGGGSVEQVAQQFYEMWYNSAGHYQNMMGNFQAVGVGVANVNGSWWATQIFGRE